MPTFSVSPEHVVRATRPMHGIGAALADKTSQIGNHVDAAAGTSGAGTVTQTFGDWSAALPQFAAAAERMVLAMTMSAAGYANTDDALAGAAS